MNTRQYLWAARTAALSVIFLMILGFSHVHAQESVSVREANWQLFYEWTIEKFRPLLTSSRVEPSWLPDSDLFWYKYKTSEGTRYWLVDPEQWEKRPLFDHAHLAEELSRLIGNDIDANSLELRLIEFSDANNLMSFSTRERHFSYNLTTKSLKQIEPPSGHPVRWENRSPDNRLCVFARGNNLFLLDGNEETQLTSGGETGYSWGYAWELVADDDADPRRAEAVWSPDSRKFYIVRADTRDVEDLWKIDFLSDPRPTLHTYKYPMPGEKVPRWELWIYDHDAGEIKRIDVDRWPDQSLSDFFNEIIWWSDDSSTLYFCRRSRDYLSADLCAVDLSTGDVRVIVEERQSGMIYIQPLTILSESDELIWWSHRDGWSHFYLYSKGGSLEGRITGGAFNAEKIVAVDEAKRNLFFSGNGHEEDRNPYYQHLYRTNLDGSGMRLLTPEDAEHDCVFSPSHEYFVDNYSRVDQPTRTVVRDREGNLLMELETADVSKLVEAGWRMPEVFTAKAADGITDMWGVMYKPFDFDPGEKYPIVTRVYPGRFDEFIPLRFSPVSFENMLANLGCVVVRFGNRGGTRARGVEYREYGRDDFRDYGLADKKAVIEQLAERHGFIDIDRVGIHGGSSGGFMTVSAMLVYPDFFKVGVAWTAPNDPSQYYNEWVERYTDIERVEREDGSISWEANAATNIELADQLKGHLLMVYGSDDDLVHLGHLFRMADAFIKAGKYFDMFVIPGVGHSLGDWRYPYGIMWRYFADHLIEERIERIDMDSAPH